MKKNIQEILQGFNTAPGGVCLMSFFEAQVAQSQDKVAVVCGDSQLTYQALDQRANQLAGYLISLGVGPGMLVGICLMRSLDMVVAILGVIKAGGAYVPLDPSYPVDRLAFILHDAQSQFVLTQNEFLGLFTRQDVKMISIDLKAKEIEKYPVSRPDIDITSDNLAYVIYTSGSTGRPKGVMITHFNLVNFIEISAAALDITSNDVYLQSASIAYALSVRQLMIPLAVGATVIVADSGDIADPLALFNLIKNHKISLMDVVPSFWRSCIQRLSSLPPDEQKDLLDNSLRRIVSIGEALMSDLPRDWRFRLGHKAALVNIFGQTETTGVVATYPITPEAQGSIGVVPIGRSVPRTKIYILDSNLQPMPDGEVGELCVSNPCLALGYLNHPDLTSEKFIPNSFFDGYSKRLYRTGDMARYRLDGNIEFLGRGDFQVQIRGHRLELGEVESTLREHQAVRDCVVIAREIGPDEKYLAAYVVSNEQPPLSGTELRVFMRSRLPDYMVPSTFTFLDALPLTPNGKVNRLALPAPAALGINKRFLSEEMTLPRTAVEKSIASIWQELMKLDRVGIQENFFDLGGYSLMAVRIQARIEQDLGVRLPLTSFFHSATIAQLAELVELKVDEARHWSPVVAIQTGGNKSPFFGIHARGGSVLFWRNIVDHLPKDQPFYGIQAQGVDGIRPALNRIEDMASLYLDAVQMIQPHGPYYLGAYSLGGVIAFEMAQQLVRKGEKINLLIMLDTFNPQWLTRPVVGDTPEEIVPDFKAQIVSSRRDWFNRKMQAHYLKMKRLGWSEKLAYGAQVLSFRIRKSSIYAIAYLYRILQRRMPDGLLIRYLEEKHVEALRRYVPSPYPGKITLFRASESLELNPVDSPMGWAPLAGEGVEVHHFEATHNIVEYEYAKQLAAKLRECLEDAQKC
jgi:amino acid adenylation domain-containing protein